MNLTFTDERNLNSLVGEVSELRLPELDFSRLHSACVSLATCSSNFVANSRMLLFLLCLVSDPTRQVLFVHIDHLADFKLTLDDDVYVLTVLSFVAHELTSSALHAGQVPVKTLDYRSWKHLEKRNLAEKLLLLVQSAPINVVKHCLVVCLSQHCELAIGPAQYSCLPSSCRFDFIAAGLLNSKLTKTSTGANKHGRDHKFVLFAPRITIHCLNFVGCRLKALLNRLGDVLVYDLSEPAIGR